MNLADVLKDEVVHEGYVAFYAHKWVHDNPYNSKTDPVRSEKWRQGFEIAAQGPNNN